MTTTGRARTHTSPFAGFGDTSPLVLPDLTPAVSEQVTKRLLSADFTAWSETAAKVGHCAHPVRLHGSTTRVDPSTGQVLSSYTSASEPLGATYVRCGNRRESKCPSCSRIYARDTFELIRAGVAGGKTVPASVADNPLVFATLTAPSFGHVHGLRAHGSKCRPRDRAKRCVHGRPIGCLTAHQPGDEVLGQPICGECYDYPTHLVWQWFAPELWRRFVIALRRKTAQLLGVDDTRLSGVATIQYAKVGEEQQRGVVHFHALIRIDGPKAPEGFGPAPSSIDASTLAGLIREAVAAVTFDAPPVVAEDVTRTLRFGVQTDARPVTSRRDDLDGDVLSAEQVAGYLAKYATKSASDTTTLGNRPHWVRLRAFARDMGDDADDQGPYALLGKWVHMLGFRGHFSTKSRRYSITLGQLRRARQRFARITAQAQRDGVTLDVADLEARLMADEEEDTTLVISRWSYAGSGWDNDGDKELALAASARAKEYAQWKAQTRRSTPV